MTELQTAIDSGQVSAAQIEAHRAAGELPITMHDDGRTYFDKPQTLRETIDSASSDGAMRLPAEQIFSWRCTGMGLKPFMTQAQYEAQSLSIQKWYEPFKCAACTPTTQQWDAEDAERYRFLRAQSIDGEPGQPVIAVPNGMKSGYYLNAQNADFAIDTAIKGAQT